jgi:hypothetical protein
MTATAITGATATAGAAQLVPKTTEEPVIVPAGKPEPVTYESLTPAKPEGGFAVGVKLCAWAADWVKAMDATTSAALKTPLVEKHFRKIM